MNLSAGDEVDVCCRGEASCVSVHQRISWNRQSKFGGGVGGMRTRRADAQVDFVAVWRALARETCVARPDLAPNKKV